MGKKWKKIWLERKEAAKKAAAVGDVPASSAPEGAPKKKSWFKKSKSDKK